MELSALWDTNYTHSKKKKGGGGIGMGAHLYKAVIQVAIQESDPSNVMCYYNMAQKEPPPLQSVALLKHIKSGTALHFLSLSSQRFLRLET